MVEKTPILTTRELMYGAVFAAVVCVATMVIHIPVPATSGYINLGDSMVFVSALLFGAKVGGIAGGVGSALADILLGFGSWAPFTFIIKGTEGLVVGYLGKKKDSVLWHTFAVLVGGIIMVLGYFIVEVGLYGVPAAAAELPGNIFQAFSGLVVAVLIVTAVKRALPERF